MSVPYAVKSYLYLRIAMITVIVMLGAAVVVEWINAGASCWQESISAYYYTPAQGVFVGGLVAIGVCMVALKGTTEWEDIFLNLGGMLAPVVALVPTPGPGACRSVDEAVAAAPENIQNNMVALFVAGVAALVVAFATRRRRIVASMHAQTRQQRIGLVTAVVIFLGGVGWFAIDRDGFDGGAHYTAAVMLFACIVVVVLLNSRRQGWSRRYLTVAIVMIASLVVILGITLAADWAHGILVLEAVLILLFGIFWVIQTQELWDQA